MTNYKSLADLITDNDCVYAVEFADGHFEEHRLYVHDDGYMRLPCVGRSTNKVHTPFPYFRLADVVDATILPID
jgi:hypothetical protein